MYSLQLKKVARGTVSSLVFTGLVVTALSTSLAVNADTVSSAASVKTMSMNHMDMDHKHMKMTGITRL